MANATFNAGIDYFGLEAGSSDKIKVKSSAENRSKQSTSGANSYGDAAVVDSWGDTAAPSAEYDVVGTITQAAFPALGSLKTTTGMGGPVALGTVTINTQNGSAPTIAASGQMVQAGATQLRSYTLPALSVLARHRAQDFMGLCTFKTGVNDASDVEDYGLEAVSATFPIEITLAQPKGDLKTYDLHGGMATCQYTMNWYAATAPTIALSDAATALGATMSEPVTKACPEGGYTQYTWTVAFPLIGEEYTPPAQNNG